MDYGTVWVCEDCYTAHHYGMTERDGKFYAGESDTPADRKPLALIDRGETADNTCANHNGTDERSCDECGNEGYESGMDDFSWRPCEGCGSTLGGSRSRLAVFPSRFEARIGLPPGHRVTLAGEFVPIEDGCPYSRPGSFCGDPACPHCGRETD